MAPESSPILPKKVRPFEGYEQPTLDSLLPASDSLLPASPIEDQYQRVMEQIKETAEQMPLETQKAFLNLPFSIQLALATSMKDNTRESFLTRMRHATGCGTITELFELIAHEVGNEETNGPSLLQKTQRGGPDLQAIKSFIRMAVSDVIETREKEEKSLLWSLGQRAHQAILAYHSGGLARLAQENGKRPVWRKTKEGIKISPAASSAEQQIFFSEEKKTILLPVRDKDTQNNPVFSPTGEINPQVKKHFKKLLDELSPFPLTPYLFNQKLKEEEWQERYSELESSVKAILPDWPEMEGNNDTDLARFALASTTASIAREIVDPFEEPGQATMITELPFGLFPFVIAGINGKDEEIFLTVGKADAIIMRTVDGEPPSSLLNQWLRNTRARYSYKCSGWRYNKEGDYTETRTREFSLRSVLAELYPRIGSESRIEFEVIEHKMQAGDAGPGACLDIEKIRKAPDLKHLQTLYEYMFGGLAISLLVRQVLENPPFLEGSLPESEKKFIEWLSSRIDHFMERLDITALQKAVEEQNLRIKGKLVYHFPNGRIIYEEELGPHNLRAVWDEHLALLYSRAFLRKESLRALERMAAIATSDDEEEEEPREVFIQRKRVPAGWERVITKEGSDLYLDPGKLLQEMNIVAWRHFEKDEVLTLRCSIDGEEEEIRINLRTGNFRLPEHQGRMRLIQFEGLIFSKDQIESTLPVWKKLWAEQKQSWIEEEQPIKGETFSQRVIFTQEGNLVETEGDIYWNPWNRRHEILFRKLDSSIQSIVEAGGRRSIFCLFPDHEETRPSTFIYPDSHLFCFGCRRDIHIIHLPQKVAKKREEIRARRPGARETRIITPPPVVSAERGAVLRTAWDYFSGEFPGSPAWDYLGRVRGIDPQKASDLGLVGYDPGNLNQLIQEGEITIDLDQATRHGLIREDSRKPGEFFDWLQGMILFPQAWTGEIEGILSSRSGRHSNFLGRRLTRKRFLKLPGDLLEKEEPHGVFGWDMIDLAREKGELVVVEAPIDALTLLLQLGFADRGIPVISISGLGHREIVYLTKHLGLEKIVIGVNNDKPGEDAFLRLEREIRIAVPNIEINGLNPLLREIDPRLDPEETEWLEGKAPDPWRPWKDPNELLIDTVPGHQEYRYSPPEG